MESAARLRPRLSAPAVHEIEAEAALDAQIAVGRRVLERRGDLDDLVVLHVECQGATHAAIAADRVGPGLLGFSPVADLAQVELAFRRQRARRADRDAVAAVDARRSR